MSSSATVDQQHAFKKIHAIGTLYGWIKVDTPWFPDGMDEFTKVEWATFYNHCDTFDEYFHPLDHKPFVTRTYGSSRKKKPPELEDFVLRY